MRQRLLEATVDCLVEHGWSGTSTTLVSKRAGVSRGAQLHHFPTKNDLVIAAVEHLTEVRGAELAAAAEQLPSGKRRTRAVLEMLANQFTSPVFTAALELWVAARTDPALQDAVGPLEQRIGRETHRNTVELLGIDESRRGTRELVQATLDLVRGLGLANTISDDTNRRKRILDQWSRTLDDHLRTEAPNGIFESGEGTMTEAPAARTRLDEVLADLTQEGDVLEEMVAPLDESGWRTPTPAQGWDIAHQIAHLAWTDAVAVTAATDKQAWDDLVMAANNDPTGYADAQAAEGAAADPADLLERWRSGRKALVETLASHPQGERIPWFGPPMSATSMATARFMETWAHGRDVADALGELVAPSRRIRHVVHLGVRTRDYAFSVHGLEPPKEEFRVELVAPNGDPWTYGPEDAEQLVRGSAYDFCLLVTQRRNRIEMDLTARGDDANTWLDIAQAFAGPPGSGREPGLDPSTGSGHRGLDHREGDR